MSLGNIASRGNVVLYNIGLSSDAQTNPTAHAPRVSTANEPDAGVCPKGERERREPGERRERGTATRERVRRGRASRVPRRAHRQRGRKQDQPVFPAAGFLGWIWLTRSSRASSSARPQRGQRGGCGVREVGGPAPVACERAGAPAH